MPKFVYGSTRFDWVFQREEQLKHHYVTVERNRPVLLRGPLIDETSQVAFIRRRARWIRDRLADVNSLPESPLFVTGSRLRYRGKTYYCSVNSAKNLVVPKLRFNDSRFFIDSPEGNFIRPQILGPVLLEFLKVRAMEKLIPRVRYWERQTGLQSTMVRIQVFKTRWASCTKNNVVAFHPRCMELAPSVLDYVIIHELCHTLEKNHAKVFRRLLAKHCPDWESRQVLLDSAAKELSL